MFGMRAAPTAEIGRLSSLTNTISVLLSVELLQNGPPSAWFRGVELLEIQTPRVMLIGVVSFDVELLGIKLFEVKLAAIVSLEVEPLKVRLVAVEFASLEVELLEVRLFEAEFVSVEFTKVELV